VNDPQPDPSESTQAQPKDAWTATLEQLQGRFPGTRDGVLFCLHKLEQNPEARLTDFRDEANLYGIPLSGRSLHSAKVLLGMAERPIRTVRSAPPASGSDTRSAGRADPAPHSGAASLEAQLTSALQQIQGAATQQSQRLREAMQQAINTLQQALDES